MQCQAKACRSLDEVHAGSSIIKPYQQPTAA